MSLNQAAKILIERQVEAHVASHVALIPACSGQGSLGRAVGKHEYHIFRRTHLACRRASRDHGDKNRGGKKDSFQHMRKDKHKEKSFDSKDFFFDSTKTEKVAGQTIYSVDNVGGGA